MVGRGFEREYQAAARRAAKADEMEPRAKFARYDKRSRRIIVDLRSGAQFIFPSQLAERLSGASDAALSNIRVSPSGSFLHWPDLDADFSVAGLMAGVFGTRTWMAELRRRRSRTEDPVKSKSAQ